MALSLTDFTDRIDTDLIMYGAMESSTKTGIMKSAVIEYMKKVDRPTISASLSVDTETTKYAIPTTIDRIEDVRDSDGDSVSISLYDTLGRYITFASAPEADGIYTVYGTPKDIKSNLSTVVAAIDENDENVLWAYVEAYSAKAASDNEWIALLNHADKTALDTLRARNRSMSMKGAAMRFIDAEGNRIDTYNNPDGITPDLYDCYEGDY